MTDELIQSVEPIHEWFGLTYSNYLVLRRSVMQQMPLNWQREMVDLVEQMQVYFEGIPDVVYKISAIDPQTKRFIKDPLAEYRYPQQLKPKETLQPKEDVTAVPLSRRRRQSNEPLG